MGNVLPIVIICSVGLAACFGFLTYTLVRFVKQKFCRSKHEEFDLDDDTYTVQVGKSNFRK
ncbi:unknown [Corallococcus sp. CAG:1435]|nr:unknown [Corallococcus sp. CAG:1435]